MMDLEKIKNILNEIGDLNETELKILDRVLKTRFRFIKIKYIKDTEDLVAISNKKDIKGIIEDFKSDPWLKKSFPKLSWRQLKFVEDYLTENLAGDAGEFHRTLNRMYIPKEGILVLNGVDYLYEDVFPHGENISFVQEIISNAFSVYINNNK